MAFYSGTQVNAAGSLVGILDTQLVKNANWSIYDAAVGTNNKTYKCATAGAVFYLNVADNQTDYATVSIWEGWDDVTHAGIGMNTATYNATYWRKMAGTYYIHLTDERVIYTCLGTGFNYSHFAGNVERYNTNFNIPILVGSRQPQYSSINPLGFGGWYSPSYTWIALPIHLKVPLACYVSEFGIDLFAWKEKNTGWFIKENIIWIERVARAFGVMRGVQSLCYTSSVRAGVDHGDTITVGGNDIWDVIGSGYLAIIRRA